MVETRLHSHEGIYVGYLTGIAGTSMGIFIFKNGLISGADIGRMSYDGQYIISDDKSNILGSVTYTMPPGETSITGAAAAAEPMTFTSQISLPVDFAAYAYHRIETPLGPVNVRFEKIRDI